MDAILSRKRQSEQQLNIYLEYSSKEKSRKNLLKTSPVIKNKQSEPVYEDQQIPKNVVNDREFTSINQTIIEYEDKLTFALSHVTPSSHVNGIKILKQFNKWNGNVRNSLFELFDTFQMMGLDNISFTVSQLLTKIQKVQTSVLNKTLMLLNHIQSQYLKGTSPLSGNSVAVMCQECGRSIEKVHLENLKNYLTKVNQTTDQIYSAKRWRKQIQMLGKLLLIADQEKQFSTNDSNDFVALITDMLNTKNNVMVEKTGETYDYLVDYLSTIQENAINISGDAGASIQENMQNAKIRLKLQNNRPSFDVKKTKIDTSLSNINEFEAVTQIFGQSFDKKSFYGLSEQMKEPLQKIIRKICQFAQYKYKPAKPLEKTDNACQTSLIKPSDQMKILQKQNLSLERQLQMIKKTKRQLQIQTIKQLQRLQANETKISQLYLSNKSLEYEHKKAQQQLKISEQTLKYLHKNQQQQLESFISKSVQEKQGLNYKLKQLQKTIVKLTRDHSDRNHFKNREVQTQIETAQKDIQTQYFYRNNCETPSLFKPLTTFGDQEKGSEQSLLQNSSFNQNLFKMKLHRRNSNFNMPYVTTKKGALDSIGTRKSIKLQQDSSEKNIVKNPNIKQEQIAEKLTGVPHVRIMHLPSKKIEECIQPQKINKKLDSRTKNSNLLSVNSIGNYIDSQQEMQQKLEFIRGMRRKNSSIAEIQVEDNQSQKQNNEFDNQLSLKNTESLNQKISTVNSPNKLTINFKNIQKNRKNGSYLADSSQYQSQSARGSSNTKKIRKSRLQKVFESLQDKVIYQQSDYSLTKQKKHKLNHIIQINYQKLMKMGVIQFLEQLSNNQSSSKSIANSSGNSTPVHNYRLKKGKQARREVTFGREHNKQPQLITNSYDGSITADSIIRGLLKSTPGLSALNMVSSRLFSKTTLRYFDNASALSSKSNLLNQNDAIFRNIKLFPELCKTRYPSSVDLDIFGGKKEAIKVQKKQGFWDEPFLAVDNFYMKQAQQIVSFFMFLKKLNQQCYLEYYHFLKLPITYLNKQQLQKQRQLDNQSESSDIQSTKQERKFLLKIFRTVIRMHKMSHRNCSHIVQFMDRIPCYKKYCELSIKP